MLFPFIFFFLFGRTLYFLHKKCKKYRALRYTARYSLGPTATALVCPFRALFHIAYATRALFYSFKFYLRYSLNFYSHICIALATRKGQPF
jgi:hypothetical protein